MTKTFNAKYLHEKLKRKWTPADFAKDLKISEETFWELIEKQFHWNTYKEFKASLQANEKHHRRVKSQTDILLDSDQPESVTQIESNDREVSSDQSESITQIEPSDSKVSSENYCFEETFNPDSPASEPSPTLEELNSDLEQVIAEINEEELNHKEIVSSRIAFRNQFAFHQASLIAMKKQMTEHTAAIDLLINQLADTKVLMFESTAKLQLLQEEKTNLEAQIKRAKQVSIFLYNSGEIEVDTQSSIQFPDSNDLFTQIIEEEELTSLTIKQAKSLAKVIAFVRSLITQATPYEVFFEDTVSEGYFQKVIS